MKKKKSKKSKSRSPHTVMEEPSLANSDIVPPVALDGDKVVPLKESASSSSSRLSLDSMTEDGHSPLYVALTTPHDLVSGEAMAAANATALVLSASTAPQPVLPDEHSPVASAEEASRNVSPSEHEQNYTQQPLGHTERSSPDNEMRSAMLALSKMKDELELGNR